MAFSIEDVNSRTILQQFHALYKNQEETNAKVEDVESDLDQEIQDRTNADIGLSEQIGALQSQLDAFGTIFTLKGSVATVADLPAENNHVGDVWYVESVSAGYIWIDDNGTERWEQLGITVDLSNYVTNDDLSTALSGKQDTLTAGTNISIIDNVISASGGSNNAVLLDNSAQTFDDSKILKLKSTKTLKFQDENSSDNNIELSTSGSYASITLSAQKVGGLSNSLYIYPANSFGDAAIMNTKRNSSAILKFPNDSGTLALKSDISAKVPDAPTTDGIYVLKAVVSSGVATYQWILES